MNRAEMRRKAREQEKMQTPIELKNDAGPDRRADRKGVKDEVKNTEKEI